MAPGEINQKIKSPPSKLLITNDPVLEIVKCSFGIFLFWPRKLSISLTVLVSFKSNS